MHCSIYLKGHLDHSWQEWLGGLTILHETSGTTVLTGTLPDQAALYGVLVILRRLNLTLLSLETDESHEMPSLFRKDAGIHLIKENMTVMWTLSATAHTSAPASRVWAAYCDVANWPRWDSGIAFYQPDGSFTTGTSGILQAVGGPELPFTLVLVEEGRTFTDRTALGPEHAIIGRHELIPLADGTQITHTVEIEGSQAEEFAQQLGFKQEELDETVIALARYAEENLQD